MTSTSNDVLNSPRAAAPEMGLVLAAGLGSRLEAAKGGSRLKPLLAVGGEPLILRVISGLERAGCKRICIVLGFLAEELERELSAMYQGKAELTFVENKDYKKSNGLSVLAAKAELSSSFLLSMSDHLLSDEMLTLAAKHRPIDRGAALLVDYKVATVFDLDDATKVKADGRRLLEIGKQLTDYNCIDTGLFVATPGLVDAIDAVAKNRGDASLSEGIFELSRNDRMEVLDIGDAFWADIDTPEMLHDAETRLKG